MNSVLEPSDSEQSEADMLLDWFDRRCSPEAAGTIRERIEGDADYREFARGVFRQHSMVLWMRDRRRKIARPGVMDPSTVLPQLRADTLARDPLLGVNFPEAGTGPIRAIGMYAPPAPDADFIRDPTPPAGHPALGSGEVDPERRAWEAARLDFQLWLAGRPSFLFAERRLLPRDAERHVAILFELLLPLMGPSVAASFFERTIVGEDTDAARLVALRVQHAHHSEGLDGRIALRLLVAVAEARTRHLKSHDPESQRIEQALADLELEEAEDGPSLAPAGKRARTSAAERDALLDAQVERDLAIMVEVLDEIGAREIAATIRHG